MKKISFVSTTTWPLGGSEDLWAQTAMRMAGRGISVSANIPDWTIPNQPVEDAVKAGCRLTRRKSRWPRRIFDRFQYHWLDSERPDLVVLSTGTHLDGGDWMRECRRREIPYAVVTQCVVEDRWPADATAVELAAGYEAARACFFVSQANREFVRRQLATPISRAKIVRNPCRVSYDAAPAWPEPDGAWRVACVGRLEPASKGQDILIDVVNAQKWRDRPLHVTFFGSGMCEGNLAHRAQFYGLRNVTFGGFARNVESIWATHHALVLPSRFEGLPLAIVEAMLCNRLCIVTDVSGNAELLEDNVSGFIAGAAKARYLDEAMERAWLRKEEWAQIGQEAGRQVRKQVPRDPADAFAEELLRV